MNDTGDQKVFVDERSHILDSYRLGEKIFADGFEPTFIVGLWRGGSAVALVVQECFAYLGVPTEHTTIRTSYSGREQYEQSMRRFEGIRVHGKSYALEALSADDRLLIVDDVFRTGRHSRAVVIAFAKEENALAWVTSPEVTPIHDMRRANASSKLIVIRGVDE